MKAIRSILILVSAVVTALPAQLRADDGIRTYTIPKEQTPVAAPAQPVDAMRNGDVPLLDSSSAVVHWKTPAAWQELPRTSVRIGNFAITAPDGRKAEVAITSFPGLVGSEVDNVNRWRRELALAPVDESGVSSEPVVVDSIAAKLYDFTGESTRTVVADVLRDGASWFFKLKGEKTLVAEARPVFLDFLKSIQFGGGAAAVAPAIPAADPHAGLGLPDPHPGLTMPTAPIDASVDGAADGPKWTVPAGWTERAAGPMVVKSFSVAAAGGEAAVVSISVFPGSVGGALANVNRWRGQMGSPPVTEDDLSKATESIDVDGGKATLVDITGIDSRSGNPARLVAAMVPHGDQTWFYKLLGPVGVVATEKDNFVKFVRTTHYP